ncbi:hypothetical protein [Methylobacterium brachythecii]|uniref:hypothetical protein n=1 Tax=Methylobacterium brachythecii TaxID=1176177 RepID=UPI001617FD5A|nr:hypothetical protein [Methylobacterium brachythecii]
MLGSAMPKYFFNVHDNGPPHWDDTGLELTWRDDIAAHALRLIVAAKTRQKSRGDIGVTTTVIVHFEEGSVALTAIARPGRNVLFVWPPD